MQLVAEDEQGNLPSSNYLPISLGLQRPSRTTSRFSGKTQATYVNAPDHHSLSDIALGDNKTEEGLRKKWFWIQTTIGKALSWTRSRQLNDEV